ncbi:MAG: NDP-sugar synthase [Patescibacteria group bacterium]|nr:NDP-sugar synthase [Patescibacteria group bacterium]MDD5715906.1 NDP-sugar synthase [Patescibacteria group bacterium]
MDRKRLTITLKKDLLPLVDEVIDGARIRNRSHAIEYLLGQALGPRVKRALILAGGRGIKMRPFTYEIPKTLIPVHGKPILEYSIELLRDAGLRDILIHIGHLGDKIVAHFGDGKRFGVKITYLREEYEHGTAAPIRQAKKLLDKEPFIMMYGDTLIDINIRDMIEFHLMHGAPATMAITSSPKPYEFGVAKLRGSKVVGFREKPQRTPRISHFINAGLFIFNPSVLALIPPRGRSMLEQDVLPRLADQGQLYAYPFEGQWFDVSTPEIYEEVLKEWKR